MSWGAVIIGGSALAGGLISASASGDAASAQSSANSQAIDAQVYAAELAAGATKEAAAMAAEASLRGAELGAQATRDAAQIAAETQLSMYYQSRKDLSPYTEAGQGALSTLQQMMADGPGEFTEDPGYQFRLNEGNDNILANAAATGSLASGRTLKALQEYGQDYASYEYDKFIDRYYQSLTPYQYLTSIGQSSAAMQASNAMATGANLSNNYMQMGSNLSSLYSNSGNQQASIYNNLGNSLANIYQNQGTAIANGYMNQGNIAATNSINQANAWTGAINSGLTGLAYYYGSGGYSSGYNSGGGYQYTPTSYNSTPYSSQSLQYLPINF